MSIFEEQLSRKPNLYPWTEQFIESMHNGFWTDKEFSFQSDVQQYKTELTEQEQEIIARTLSAIGQIEVAVKTFWAKLGENLPHPALQDLGYVMANTEVIHNNAYERLLSVLDMEDIFEENLKLDFIDGRVKYLRKYTHKFYSDSKKQYLYALTLFTLFVENVSLFSQFYIINHFARFKNVLKDTDQQVKYTRNEENIHALVGIKIINTIREEHPELFDIDFHYNKYLFDIAASHLVSFDVDYHGEGTPSYFGPQGTDDITDVAPTSVTVSMTFQETTITTKEEIARGNR